MNPAHAHLVLNHVPVIGAAFTLLLLFYGFMRRSNELLRAGLIAAILVGVTSIAAYRTGEPAEDAIEKLPGVSKDAIHEHEEAAEIAGTSAMALGVFGIVGLVLGRRDPMPRWIAPIALGLCLLVSVLMAYAANLGGHIRHPEILGATAVTPEHD